MSKERGIGPVPEGLAEPLYDYLNQVRRAITAGNRTGALTGAFTSGLGGVGGAGGSGSGSGGSTTPDLTPPPTPTGVTVGAGIDFVGITTDAPTFSMGNGYNRTIVYGAKYSGTGPLPTFASAVIVHEFVGQVGTFPTEPATQWHIWTKWRTNDGVESVSPSGGTNGHQVTTGQDVTKLMEALTGEITQSQLFSTLSSRIDLIDAPSGTAGSVNARIASETNARTSADTALANSITTVSSTVASKNRTFRQSSAPVNSPVGTLTEGDIWYDSSQNNRPSRWSASGNAWILTDDTRIGENSAAINVEAATRANADGHLSAQYTVRTQLSANGQTVVGGFGISGVSSGTAGTTIDFGVVANRFYIAPPLGTANVPSILPFIVQTTPTVLNGATIPAGVYMDSAYIRDLTAVVARMGNAWITNAMVASLAASKITAGSIAVGEYIQSSDYVSGTSGWRIGGNMAEFGFANIRGVIQAHQVAAGFISAGMMETGIMSADNVLTRGMVVRDSSGNVILNSGGLRNAVYGLNLLYNGDFASGFDGWLSGGFGLTVIGSGFNAGSFAIAPTTARGNTVAYLATGPNTGTPLANIERYTTPAACQEGDRMCVSAYVGSQRADSEIILYWTDVNGNPFASSPAGSAVSRCTAGEALGGSLLSQYKRIYNIGVAPAGTYGCALSIRKYDTLAGQPDSYVFWTKCQIEPLAPLANAPGPWMPPAYTSKITATNASTFIESAAINYLSLAGGATSVSNVMNFSGTNANDGFAGQMQVSIPANGHLYVTGYYRCLPDATFYSATTRFSFAANVRVAILKNGTQIATKTFFNNIVNGPWVGYMQASGSAVGTDAAAIGWGIAVTATAGDVFTVQAFVTTFQFAPAGGSSYIGQIYEGVLHVSGLYR